ncbi:MAG: DUF721 domain-containing protein [Thiopseudomonas sp.]|jgi:hypothetical protein
MNKPLKPATQILRGSPRLQRLLRQAESLSKLQALLYQHLAPAQREQLQLGGYDEGVLTLILADAAWATRLRYQQGRLLQQLRQHDEFSGLQHIRLKIRPASAAPPARHEERRFLSDTASQNIRRSAESIEDPELREALKRLAQNIRPD